METDPKGAAHFELIWPGDNDTPRRQCVCGWELPRMAVLSVVAPVTTVSVRVELFCPKCIMSYHVEGEAKLRDG